MDSNPTVPVNLRMAKTREVLILGVLLEEPMARLNFPCLHVIQQF
jgi:hypothetical protein